MKANFGVARLKNAIWDWMPTPTGKQKDKQLPKLNELEQLYFSIKFLDPEDINRIMDMMHDREKLKIKVEELTKERDILKKLMNQAVHRMKGKRQKKNHEQDQSINLDLSR
ncbi:MAG: hypothetical protein HQL69_02550 [Magnetococcales bacterium]|nr:hypothetical protein [Magnetococcales bacterium]